MPQELDFGAIRADLEAPNGALQVGGAGNLTISANAGFGGNLLLLQSGGTGALAVSGNGLVAVAASGGIDTSAPGTLNLGSATATAVQVGRSGQSVGFYGVAPVVKATAIAAPTAPGATYLQAEAPVQRRQLTRSVLR